MGWFSKPTPKPKPHVWSSYVCSFCGRSHGEVDKLITGPGVNICDSCITVCKNLLDKETNDKARLSAEVAVK